MTIQTPTIHPSDWLFDYQKNWLSERAKYVLWAKSRRIGATWIEALASIQYCLETGLNSWFTSTDEKNGREFILYCQQWASHVINPLVGSSFIDLSKATSECVHLPNGSRITCLSSNPKQLRGKDGRIIIDEAALHEDQEELFRAAQGCVVQRGCLRLISTFDGPANLFFKIYSEAPGNGWTIHQTTLEDACRQGYALRFAKHLQHLGDKQAINRAFVAEVKRSCLSEDVYNQEFNCRPLSLKALLAAEEYDALKLWPVPDSLSQESYHPLFVGIDIGGLGRDETVIWVLERWENPKATGQYDQYDYKTVCVRQIRHTQIPVQIELIKQIISHPAVERVFVDIGAIGHVVVDSLQQDYPTVVPFGFTASRKAELAERLKGFVSYQRLSLPPDEQIREDFLALQRVPGGGGNVKYEGRTRHSHCDSFWACALALHAAEEANGAIQLVKAG